MDLYDDTAFHDGLMIAGHAAKAITKEMTDTPSPSILQKMNFFTLFLKLFYLFETSFYPCFNITLLTLDLLSLNFLRSPSPSAFMVVSTRSPKEMRLEPVLTLSLLLLVA